MRIPITRTRLLFAVLAVYCVQTAIAVAREEDSIPEYKREFIESVFRDIIYAIDDEEEPYLEIRPGKSKSGTDVDLQGSTIYIDEHLVDLCSTFGKDSANALAFFICHELVHYYRRHKSVGVEVSEQELKRIRKNIHDEHLESEAEADYFAGFYGRMAGYDPLKKAKSVLDEYYEDYNLEDRLPGYPSLVNRKSIADNVNNRLKELIVPFDAANCLGMIRNYDESQRCYDHVISTFSSRELLNNAGVVYTLRALQLMDSQAVRFVYPLELDVDTRLRGVVRAVRAPDARDLLFIRSLLDSAHKRFARAIRCDRTYVTAKINIATILILKEQYDEALDTIGTILHNDVSDYTRVLVRTAEAIARLRKGEVTKGMDVLRSVQELAGKEKVEELVAANLRSLDPPLPSKPRKIEFISVDEEIDGIDATDTGYVLLAGIYEEIDDRDVIYNRKGDFNTAILVLMDTSWTCIIRTESTYDGVSGKNIAIGSPGKDVIERYNGEPRIINSRQGKFYIYDFAKIIFLVDPNDKVKQWMIYNTG